MYYDKEQIYKTVLEIVQTKKLYNIEDIVAFLPIGKTAFYDYFPIGSNEMNTIKSHCDNVKIDLKAQIRTKLLASDKAAELIALYKLIATDDERKALSMQQIDHTTKGESLNKITAIEVIHTTNEATS